MNQGKLLKFTDSTVQSPSFVVLTQMNVIRNTAMQTFGNIVAKYLIFLQWQLSLMDPFYVYTEV
jgi:hypothetical protein